jgi:glycosyltransferase involved in cell wall biosynthesis
VTARRIVCLLPARNAAELLPGYLESATLFADAVVALDDGSTDDTGPLLRAHPLVHIVLTNRRREGYIGWHDGANRSRLLAAAAELDPEWVFSLDADERLDAGDAAALRAFVRGDAVAGFAYGFQCYRMLEGETYDPAYEYVYRLFHFRPGQRLPDARFGAAPVPIDMPEGARVETTLRIKHYGEVGTMGRSARRAMFVEADPDGEFRHYRESWRELGPGPHPRWLPRPEGLPVLRLSAAQEDDLEGMLAELDLGGPVLSVVVIVSAEEFDEMTAVLAAVLAQECETPTEVLTMAMGPDVAEDVAAAHPDIRVVEVDPASSPGAVRNVALAEARGDYVLFLDAPAELAAGALTGIAKAHDAGYSMVAATVRTDEPSAAGWAAYFLDHAGALPGGAEGELAVPPAQCSFAREALIMIGGFDEWTDEGVEALAADRLSRRGHGAVRTSLVTVDHRARLSSPRELLSQRFDLGRAIGRDAGRAGGAGPPQIGTLVRSGRYRLALARRELQGAPAEADAYRRVAPLVLGGLVATWAGACYEQLRRR